MSSILSGTLKRLRGYLLPEKEETEEDGAPLRWGRLRPSGLRGHREDAPGADEGLRGGELHAERLDPAVQGPEGAPGLGLLQGPGGHHAPW